MITSESRAGSNPNAGWLQFGIVGAITSESAHIVHQAFDLALVVPLAGATEPVVEQIVALQAREHPATFAPSIAKNGVSVPVSPKVAVRNAI